MRKLTKRQAVMATHPALESAAKSFADRGRTVKQTHSIDLVEMSHRPAFLELIDSADGVTHLDVLVADGPSGPEVLVQPRAGDVGLPGELYCQVPGALGAPAAFGKTTEPGLAWVSPNGQLQEFLRTHQFGAPSLPGGQRNGQRESTFDWTVQLSALGGDQSVMVCQLSGDDPNVVPVALAIVDHVAKVTAQSRAAGPQDTLHPLRFGFIVGLALTDQLVVLPPPLVPTPTAPVATPARAERVKRLVMGMFVVLLAAMAVWVARPEAEVLAVIELSDLEVQSPATHPADLALPVSIDGVIAGDVVSVVIESSYGIRPIEVVAESASIQIEIAPSDHAEAGLVVIDVWAPNGYGSTTVELTPGEAAGPLDVYLGPRSMFANGEDLAMVVAVPVDVRGNPVAAGTRVDTRTIRPDLAVEVDATTTSGLLGYRIIFSETLAGATTVSATSGAAIGPARRVDEVANTPVNLGLVLLDPVPSADGTALVRIATNELVDQFGNLLPDGTIVTLDAVGVTGVRRQTAATIAAVATFVVQVPDRPGQATFTGYVSTATSPSLIVDFEPAVAELPVRASLQDEVTAPDGVEAGFLIEIGSVTTPLGSLIPDGTLALVTLEPNGLQANGSDHRIVRRTQLYRGEGTITITRQEFDDFGGEFRLTVTVLGVEAVADWPRP